MLGLGELLIVVQRYQPEARLCVVEETVTLAAVALDERRRPEIVQARAGAG